MSWVCRVSGSSVGNHSQATPVGLCRKTGCWKGQGTFSVPVQSGTPFSCSVLSAPYPEKAWRACHSRGAQRNCSSAHIKGWLWNWVIKLIMGTIMFLFPGFVCFFLFGHVGMQKLLLITFLYFLLYVCIRFPSFSPVDSVSQIILGCVELSCALCGVQQHPCPVPTRC